MPTSHEDDIRAIEAVIDARAQSMRAKNGAGTMATQAPSYFQYPLFATLQYAGETATGLDYTQTAFDGFDGLIGYEVIEQTVFAGGDLGVSHSLSRISGTQASGAVLDMWFRKTLTFIRTEGTWLIAQEHESVPIAADGSAAMNLKP